jgi:hypothetical protein
MRNALAIRLAGAAAIGALAIACSASTASNPYPDVSSFCSAVAKAECQDNAVCAIDQTQCETYRTSVCQQDAASAQASGRTYNSDNAKACIDALNGAFGNGASKVTYQQLYGSGSITDKCERVFVGNAGNGGACQTNYDCTDSSEICAPVPGMTGSQCAKPTQKNLGDACADPGDQCADGSYCSTQGGGIPKCVASAADGAPCPSGVQCVSSDFCNGGICAAKSGPGGPCTQDSDCNSQAPYCDPYAGHICTIGLTFATGAPDCKGYFLGAGTAGADAGTGGSDAGGGDSGGSDAGAADGPTGG